MFVELVRSNRVKSHIPFISFFFNFSGSSTLWIFFKTHIWMGRSPVLCLGILSVINRPKLNYLKRIL